MSVRLFTCKHSSFLSLSLLSRFYCCVLHVSPTLLQKLVVLATQQAATHTCCAKHCFCLVITTPDLLKSVQIQTTNLVKSINRITTWSCGNRPVSPLWVQSQLLFLQTSAAPHCLESRELQSHLPGSGLLHTHTHIHKYDISCHTPHTKPFHCVRD